MIKLIQQQKLAQKLSPQQIHFMKLLQVPTAALEDRIKDEIEQNPALELSEYQDKDKEQLSENYEEIYTDKDSTDDNDISDNVDFTDYLQTEDEANGIYNYSNDDDEEDRSTPGIKIETTFFDYLYQQADLLQLNEKEREIINQIIGNIDDDGYLRREPIAIANDLAFKSNIDASEKEVKSVLELVHQFDPPGVGAKDLQECLCLQLYRLTESDEVKNAILILQKCFENFTKKKYDRVRQKLKINETELKDAIAVILKLTPKPGASLANVQSNVQYVIPDFFVFNNNGRLELSLNARNAPDLIISDNYKEMFKSYNNQKTKNKAEKEAVLFIKQKIDAAKWFIDMIKQRQQTMLTTMNAILVYQHDFFISGDVEDLKPMILKDIADTINMDISTVSRVANSKYVQTEFGTFILKFFFSEAVVLDSGEEVRSDDAKRLMLEFIAQEDKQNPLSDEQLLEFYKEKGYTIARRTVAKYRELLNIPVARLRKEV